jgi:hypothetical protein
LRKSDIALSAAAQAVDLSGKPLHLFAMPGRLFIERPFERKNIGHALFEDDSLRVAGVELGRLVAPGMRLRRGPLQEWGRRRVVQDRIATRESPQSRIEWREAADHPRYALLGIGMRTNVRQQDEQRPARHAAR